MRQSNARPQKSAPVGRGGGPAGVLQAASMDEVTLLYYAAVCAALGLAGPRLGRWHARLLTGALVGVAAAAMLPTVRGLL